MSLFVKPAITPPTKEQQVALKIDINLRNAAISLKNAYSAVRAAIYDNPAFKDEYGVTDSNAIYTAFVTNTTTGLTAEQLVEAAIIVKSVVNKFAPGTIVDDVPEATITLPQG